MELDRALELAVISSWKELVAPDEPCSLHVVYENVSDLAVNSVEVWKVKNLGYEALVCSYCIPRSQSSAPRLHFANAYHSDTLVNILDFIMRHQRQFSRPSGRSSHGLIQIDPPSDESRKIASVWSSSIRRDSVDTSGDDLKRDTSSQLGDSFSKKEKAAVSDVNKETPTKEEIRLRAFELFSARGRADGKDLEDWLAAERELIEHTISVAQESKTAKAG